MAPYARIYSDDLRAALKKGQGFKKELMDEILRVLLTDPDVQRLIRDRTSDKYQDLVERSE